MIALVSNPILLDGKLIAGLSLKAIYVHHDGYLDGNGLTLLEHYQDIEKVTELLNLGGMSSLRPTIAECKEQAYAQKGEKIEITECGYKDFLDEVNGDGSDIEFVYFFVDGKWYFLKTRYGSPTQNFPRLLTKIIIERGE